MSSLRTWLEQGGTRKHELSLNLVPELFGLHASKRCGGPVNDPMLTHSMVIQSGVDCHSSPAYFIPENTF